MIEFTIIDESDQQFSAVLNGQRVTIRMWYATFNDRWSIDISVDGEPKLHGRKVVAGSDLLESFDLDIGVIFAYSEKPSEPGRDELPDGIVKIYHAAKDEINASVSS